MTDPRAAISDRDFINLFEKLGPHKLSRKIGCNIRSVYRRRHTLEKNIRRQITSPQSPNSTRHNIEHAARLHFDVENGVVLIGSDAHIWPGPMTTAMRAFVKFCKDMKPKAVVMNGDVMDHPQISRHPPIGWEDHPTVEQEIKAAQEILTKIEDVGPSKLYWGLGNHDARFETRLATIAPEFARVSGFRLKDHFPAWSGCWATWFNDDVVVTHRLSGGIGAVRNNVLRAGKSMVTGHLHSLKVTPFTDYNGTRYGVDSGCLADPRAEAFVQYTEDAPLDWRSGFVVLTFHKGKLLFPELVSVFDRNHVQFRGEVIKV